MKNLGIYSYDEKSSKSSVAAEVSGILASLGLPVESGGFLRRSPLVVLLLARRMRSRQGRGYNKQLLFDDADFWVRS